MGQAYAKATTNNIQQAYVSAVQNTSNNTLNTAQNTGNISVYDTQGNVYIGDVNVDQAASAITFAQFSNTNDASVLQKVSASLSNTAGSMVSGLNLGNTSRTDSTINSYINTAINLSQNITNNCGSNASNSFNINVQGTKGDVTISKIDITQNAQAMGECISTNAQKAVAQQEQDVKAENVATAVTKGLELPNWFLFFIIGAAILLLPIGAMIIGGFAFIQRYLVFIVGFVLIVFGIELIVASLRLKFEKIPEMCAKIFSDQERRKKEQKFFVKPFFFTCGIYGKGTGCKNMFTPPVIVGSFSSITPPPITQLTSQQMLPSTLSPLGYKSGCDFEIMSDLTNMEFDSISDAYINFENRKECVGLDALFNMEKRTIQYIFYKKVPNVCIEALNEDCYPSIPNWDGTTDTPETNPWFPPLVCEVLECKATQNPTDKPSITDIDIKPFSIRITQGGYVWYFKNNDWVQVNTSSFWVGKNPPDVSNILIYRGAPSTTPNLLDSQKNPQLDLTKGIGYIDLLSETGSKFTIYWRDPGVPTSTPSPVTTTSSTPSGSDMQGFYKISEVDCTKMKNDEVVAFGPNPLLKFMNRTWVKLYEPNDKLMTSDEIDLLERGFQTETEQSNYNTCMANKEVVQRNMKIQKAILIAGGCLGAFGFVLMMLGLYKATNAPPPAQQTKKIQNTNPQVVTPSSTT